MSNADWANKDFYQVLGVAKDADQAAIKKAYRKLARENHPDSNPGDKAAEDRFKAGRRGLRRRRRRREAQGVRRDALDVRRVPAPGLGGFGGSGLRVASPTGGAGGFDVSDLFGDLFNRGGGGGGGSAAARQAPRPARGAPTSRPRRPSRFADAIDGTTISLRLSSDAPCPTCSGTGGKPGTRPHICATCDGAGVVVSSVGGGFSMNETCPECHGRQLVYDEPCPTCHGSGRGLSSRTVSARIPAGVKDGQRIRLKGKGAAGENGGPDGDLLVTVHVAPPPALRPQGRQPHPRGAGHLRRGRPRRRDQGADPAAGPGHPADPAGHPQRPGDARPRPRRPAKDGSKGDLLVTVERRRCRTTLDDAARAAGHGLPRGPRGRGPPRRPLRGWCVMAGGRRAVGPRARSRVPGPTVPVYVISVAAELTGLHPQTLRQYDRVGLVSPGRTGGGGRRYSLRDIELLREVAELTAAGIGLEGVRRILELENQVAALRARNSELRRPGRASCRPRSRRR